MQQLLLWILASASLALLLGAAVLWLVPQRKSKSRPLPTEWTLTSRPVFNSDERRVYRQLREALPHHIVLAVVAAGFAFTQDLQDDFVL